MVLLFPILLILAIIAILLDYYYNLDEDMPATHQLCPRMFPS
jgi:hypothetical protein